MHDTERAAIYLMETVASSILRCWFYCIVICHQPLFCYFQPSLTILTLQHPGCLRQSYHKVHNNLFSLNTAKRGRDEKGGCGGLLFFFVQLTPLVTDHKSTRASTICFLPSLQNPFPYFTDVISRLPVPTLASHPLLSTRSSIYTNCSHSAVKRFSSTLSEFGSPSVPLENMPHG